MSGCHGDFWDKYICVTGLFICFHIEKYYGIEGLQECIKKGYMYFVNKYESLRLTNPQLSGLPKEIIKHSI